MGLGLGWEGESNRPLTEAEGGLEAFVLGLWFWLHPTGLKLDSYWACSHLIFFHQGQSQQECSRSCYFGSVCVLLIMTTKIKVHFFSPWNILQGEFSFPSFFFFFQLVNIVSSHLKATSTPGWDSPSSRMIIFNFKKPVWKKTHITWAVTLILWYLNSRL